MRIRHKILAGYLVVFFAFSIAITAILGNIQRVQQSSAELISKRARLVHQTQELLLAFQYEALMMRTYLLTGDTEYKAAYQDEVQRVERDLSTIQGHLTESGERDLFSEIAAQVQSFQVGYAAAVLAIREGKELTESERVRLTVEWTLNQKGTVRGLISKGEEFIALEQSMLDDAVRENARWVREVMWASAALSLAAILLAAGAALFISRTIAGPVAMLEEEARKVGEGDLRPGTYYVGSRDEVGSLARSFDTMVKNLNSLAERVLESARDIRSQVGELGVNAKNAASLATSTTKRLSEMAAAIDASADRARAISESATQASAKAGTMEEQADRILEQMERSGRIAARASAAAKEFIDRLMDVNRIVEYISVTADQARLLARRVVTEARTTGEGSDLANLVIELEQRAAQAMEAGEDITRFLHAAVENAQKAVASVEEDCRLVAEGRLVAKDSLVAIEEMVEQVQALTRTIGDAVTVSGEFSGLIEGVASSVGEEAQLVENVARATETLNGICEELAAAVARFKV